jgi:hypothetical protein
VERVDLRHMFQHNQQGGTKPDSLRRDEADDGDNNVMCLRDEADDCIGDVICSLYAFHWKSVFALQNNDTDVQEKSFLSRIDHGIEGFTSAKPSPRRNPLCSKRSVPV